MACPPYHISHLALHQQLNMPLLDTSLGGHYLVFWWKEIPLGHLYIAPEEQLSETLYQQKLAKAIAPAIAQYTASAQQNGSTIANAPWQNWLQQQQLESWNRWLDPILTPLLPQALPPAVPVSIVICTRNRAVMLRRCLQMLKTLRCYPQEIIVVDNAPSDNSSELVVREFPEVIYRHEPRPGLDIARNTGIRAASQEIIAYLDDDVLVHPLWVYRVWEAFQAPEAAAITGLVIASELQTEAQQIFERHWSFNRGYVKKVYDSQYFQKTLPQGPPVWEIGAGANMAFRRSVFEKTGLFDELLDVGAAGCNGDSEMWFRILAAGYSIHYCPLAVVYHEHRRELKGLKKQIYFYMRGFAAAALLQQQRVQQAGYKKHLIWAMPPHYARSIKRGFPRYPFQYRTLWVEIKGVLSGVLYYARNKHNSSVK